MFGRFAGGLALVTAIGAGAGFALVQTGAGPAGAVNPAEIVVNDANDGTATPSDCTPGAETDCTLRSALAEAATISGAVVVNLPDPTTVAYNPSSSYQVVSSSLTLATNGAASSVSLAGAGAATTVIQALCECTINYGVLHDTGPGSTSISDVTIEDGQMYGDSGGGIWNDGTLTVTNSTITNNYSNNSGGGIFSDGTLTLQADTITANTSSGTGAGVDTTGSATLSGNTINDNAAGAGSEGGGLEIDGSGTTSLSGDTIEGNTVTEGNGGGVYIDGGTNAFTGVTIRNNTATWTSQVGGGLGGGLYVDTGTSTFTGGTISDNEAYAGGGVWATYTEATGAVNTFTQESITGNTATEAGGGLGFDTAQAGSTSVTASTIDANTVLGSVGGTPLLGDGGGILAQSCNALNFTNDTITTNTAVRGGGYDGTQCSEPSASTAFLFDTIDANAATSSTDAGNIETNDGSNLTAADTIVAGGVSGGSPTTNCSISGAGSLTSGGYNLVDDATCGTPAATDIIGKDPQLGALANNGGPTATLLPADDAVEVGAIPDAVCVATGVGTDQRGVARGAGAASSCTIGAVEVGQNFNGYRLVANEGGIFDFGLLFSGSLANSHLNAPIVGLANAPGPAGYLMVGSDGGVFALGGAAFYGSLGGQAIPSPIAAIAAPPGETGYWLVAQNGKIYPFGSVPALPAVQLPTGAHVVGMASTTDGRGAWLTDQLGDVYAEGSAQYEGGLGGVRLNAPIVGIAAAASGQGYILVATDGGVFDYGTQGFYGSVPGSLEPGQHLVAPVVGVAVTHSGKGYWEVGADGGVFTYGDAPFLGSIYSAIGNHPLNGPIVGIQHLGSVSAPA